MQLFLHIGPHKTGSSSIQRALAGAGAALAAHRILYYAPDPFPAWALAALYGSARQRAHPMLRRRFADDAAVLDWSRRSWAGLERAVAESDADLCILSSEHFAALPDPAPFLDRLAGLFSDITVLAYARDPVALYLSALQQKIQGGHRLRDLENPAGHGYPLRRQLAPYLAAVGAGNMIVRHFTRANLEDGDVVADFGARLARFGKAPALPRLAVNESLPGAVIAWLATVNETWDRAVLDERRRRVLNRLRRAPALAGLPRLRLEDSDPGLAPAIRAGARADVEWLNAVFLEDQMPLEPGPAGAAAASPEAAQRAWLRDWIMGYLSPEALRLIAAEITAPAPRAARGRRDRAL